MVGDCGAGKSSLLHYYADKEIFDTYIRTIGVDFVSLRALENLHDKYIAAYTHE